MQNSERSLKGAYKLGYLKGGGGGRVQGLIFEDIKSGFFAIIHIRVVLTFMSYDLFGSDPP